MCLTSITNRYFFVSMSNPILFESIPMILWPLVSQGASVTAKGNVAPTTKQKSDNPSAMYNQITSLVYKKLAELINQLSPDNGLSLAGRKIVSAIVMHDEVKKTFEVVSLATGNRCITGYCWLWWLCTINNYSRLPLLIVKVFGNRISSRDFVNNILIFDYNKGLAKWRIPRGDRVLKSLKEEIWGVSHW